ncbi:MAG: hypothetical protein HZB35_08700 [Nitrospirae bacterium]|nr:hypothetical protein [Nitrospirota bacterium]
MAKFVLLSRLDEYTNDHLADALNQAPLVDTLHEAVRSVIRGIHGLPEVMQCDRSQLDVYIGRAAAEPARLRQRWVQRYNKFEGWRSLHAIVCVRGLTSRIRGKGWEEKAQRLIKLLEDRGALCTANALVGNNGRWPPPSSETAIYVVARTRRGRPADDLPPSQINSAIAKMIQEPKFDDDKMVVTAARAIMDTTDMEAHEPLELPIDCNQDGSENGVHLCKICRHPAKPGNYGFCGYHRR